jgi:dimethylargininase
VAAVRALRELVAIAHAPSPAMQEYEHTFVDDQPIDLELARRQHAAYCEALRVCGASVTILDVNAAMPDCVFVEDTALVLDELAVMMSPGAISRRGEPAGIEPELAKHRPVARVTLPATIDGGDVVVAGREVYVGRSARTNDEGIAALREILAPYGYRVTGVRVHGCLHLKTACSALPDGRFLVNASWIDVSAFDASRLVAVPDDEPWAGDVLVIEERIIASDAFPRTIELLRGAGWRVVPVGVSEFAKAEGGVTCLSLVFRSSGAPGRGPSLRSG